MGIKKSILTKSSFTSELKMASLNNKQDCKGVSISDFPKKINVLLVQVQKPLQGNKAVSFPFHFSVLKDTKMNIYPLFGVVRLREKSPVVGETMSLSEKGS